MVSFKIQGGNLKTWTEIDLNWPEPSARSKMFHKLPWHPFGFQTLWPLSKGGLLYGLWNLSMQTQRMGGRTHFTEAWRVTSCKTHPWCQPVPCCCTQRLIRFSGSSPFQQRSCQHNHRKEEGTWLQVFSFFLKLKSNILSKGYTKGTGNV